MAIQGAKVDLSEEKDRQFPIEMLQTIRKKAKELQKLVQEIKEKSDTPDKILQYLEGFTKELENKDLIKTIFNSSGISESKNNYVKSALAVLGLLDISAAPKSSTDTR